MIHATIRRAFSMAGGTIALAATLAWASADCSSLPTSALRERTCNPQQECFNAIPKNAKGPQLEARRKECSRLPTTGVCHGPDTYNPQAECRAPQRKK
jgi:hypothetical protein